MLRIWVIASYCLWRLLRAPLLGPKGQASAGGSDAAVLECCADGYLLNQTSKKLTRYGPATLMPTLLVQLGKWPTGKKMSQVFQLTVFNDSKQTVGCAKQDQLLYFHLLNPLQYCCKSVLCTTGKKKAQGGNRWTSASDKRSTTQWQTGEALVNPSKFKGGSDWAVARWGSPSLKMQIILCMPGSVLSSTLRLWWHKQARW